MFPSSFSLDPILHLLSFDLNFSICTSLKNGFLTSYCAAFWSRGVTLLRLSRSKVGSSMPLPPCRLSLSDFHATNSKESTYKLVLFIICRWRSLFCKFFISLKFSQEFVVLVHKRNKGGPTPTDQSQIFLLYHNILLQLSSNQGGKKVY